MARQILAAEWLAAWCDLEKLECSDKPGSVHVGCANGRSHLSGTTIARRLVRPTREVFRRQDAGGG